MIYDFICKKCKKEKELNLSLKEYQKLKTPKCCKQEMIRVYEVPKIQSTPNGGLNWRR